MKKNKMIQMAAITLMISLMMPYTVTASELSGGEEVVSESGTETAAEDSSETGSDTGSSSESSSESSAGSDTGSGTESDAGSDTGTDSDSTADTGDESDTSDTGDTGSESGQESTDQEDEDTGSSQKETAGADQDSDAEDQEKTSGQDSDTDKQDTESESDTESDSDTESESESESEADSESDIESVIETDAVVLGDELEKLSEEEDQATDDTDEAEADLSNPEYEEVSEWLRYYTSVPFTGLPDYITQEMIYNALYEQDQYGIPASLTIAQIILDSGDGEELTDLAAEDDNLFKLTGTGSKGTSGRYAAYNTFSDSMNARIDRFQSEKMSKKIGSLDGLTGSAYKKAYALKFSQLWYGDISKGYKLNRITDKYDLERIDQYTYDSFSKMMGTFANPCPGSHITSGFGYRAWSNSQHLGIDMATYGLHIPTYAAESGTVISVGYGSSTGNMIVIDNGNGMVTKYMHHSQMYVEVGQKVLKGQQIGLAGTTGHSTGIHLHFQVEIDGTAVSPVSYLNSSGTDKTVKKSKKKTTVFATSTESLDEVKKFGEAFGVDVSDTFNALPSASSLGDETYKQEALEKLNERIGKAVTKKIMGEIQSLK